MVLEERKKKKLFFVSLSSSQAPRFLKKWGSQHFKRNHESIALPVALIGLCIFFIDQTMIKVKVREKSFKKWEILKNNIAIVTA
jgi:hypothetical protein